MANNKFFTAAEIYVRLLSAFPKKASEISKINVMRWCSEVVTEYLTDPVAMIPHYKLRLGDKSYSNKVDLKSITIQPDSATVGDIYFKVSEKILYEYMTVGHFGATAWVPTGNPIVNNIYVYNYVDYKWSGTNMNIITDDSSITYTIKDGKVLLPFDCFKLESVYDQNNSLVKDMSNQGDYIYFSSVYMPEKVFIDYYSIPVDADGFPLVKRGYEAACYAYCVYKMFEEDASVIPPRIQQWRWLQIVDDKEHELGAARSSWSDLTDNDIRDIHNYIIDPNYIRMITGVDNKDTLDGGSIFNQK